MSGDRSFGVPASLVPADGSITSAKIADGTIVDADISASAAISASKVAGVMRAADNLSDLDDVAQARINLELGGAAVLNVGTASSTVAAGNDSRITGAAQKASNLGDLPSPPTALTNLGIDTDTTLAGNSDTRFPSQKAVKTYVDSAAQGLVTHASSRLATVAALPANTYASGVLTATSVGVLTVDGVTVALNDRVLVKDEAAQSHNGIYSCTTAGAGGVAYVLTRATDMDAANEVPGAYTFVTAGTANANSGWTVASPGPYTIGTTAIVWTQFSQAGTIVAGTGLTKSGSTISVDTTVTPQKSDTLAVFAATSSAQLRGVLLDETGTGAAVFGTSPALSAPTGLDKGDVGLSNVDNTSDANKPVSTAQAAADALATTVINVKNALYGAVGDGSTVDSTAVQAAITAAVAAGGGTVFFPAGTYIISGVYLASNVTLRGAGMGATVLKLDPASAASSVTIRVANGSTASASFVGVEHLTIDGNKSAWGAGNVDKHYGYYLGTTSGVITNCWVKNVEIKNCKTYALDILGVSKIVVDNLHSHDNGYTTGTNNDCSGIELAGACDGIALSNLHLHSNANKGLIAGSSSTTMYRVTGVNVHVWSNTSDGIMFHDNIQDSGLANVTAVSNGSAGVRLASGTNNCWVEGLSASGNSIQGLRLDAAVNNVCTGLALHGNATAGVGNPELLVTNTSTGNRLAGQVNATTATNAIKESTSADNGNVYDIHVIAGAVTLAGATSSAVGLRGENNLSDLSSASTARTSLGLGTAATKASVDVQVFTSSGTWTMPTGAVWVDVLLKGAGAGGGSGRQGAAGTVRCGGGGGSGSGITSVRIAASAITSPVTVTIGAAGAGGAAVTGADTDGNNGVNGGSTLFGTYARSQGGSLGSGGTNATGTGGGAAGGTTAAAAGGAASTTGGVGVNGTGSNGSGGGGAGGGITSGDSASNGGAGGTAATAGNANASAGVVDSTGPSVGGAQPANSGLSGGGGGGGAASKTTTAQTGAVGGIYGAGGGGGGASLNGNNSGAGGSGAAGIAVITTYF